MVGAEGIEPSTFWSRTKRATRLRYAPIKRKTSVTLAKRRREVKGILQGADTFIGAVYFAADYTD